jgi:hypothetical protein
MTPPVCVSAIWDPKTADYCFVMPQKERNRIIAEENKRAENDLQEKNPSQYSTHFEKKGTTYPTRSNSNPCQKF